MPKIEPDLYAYIGGICRGMESPLLCINGTADHLHMLISLSKTETLSNLMLNVKRDSSKWMHRTLPDFEWQEGYFAFSIGESGVPALRRYIESQKEHHRNVDFKDELRTFFRKYGIEWDERYVWT